MLANRTMAMKKLTQSAINVFAVLEDFNSGNGDVLDSLCPFLEPILTERRGETYNPEEIAEAVREAYKWNFYPDIAEEFIPRFLARGWLALAEGVERNGPYSIVIDEQSKIPTDENSIAKFEELAGKFQAFCEEQSPLTAINRSPSEFKDVLIEWLIYVDAYNSDALGYQTGSKQLPDGKLVPHVSVPRTTSLTNDEIYLCARFVEKALLDEPELAITIEKIAGIGLLTEVVQDFHRPTNSVENTDLVVFLDSPIAMELMGVSGKAAQDNLRPIIEGLQNIGAEIRLFSQSIEEISGILKKSLNDSNPTGPTARSMARGEVLRQYVQSVSNDPEGMLGNFGVSVVHRTLDQYPQEEPYFTQDDIDQVYSRLGFQLTVPRREHDTTVTALVMRQRKGHGSQDIFGTSFVLLTRNGPFAQAALRACQETERLATNHVSPVVHRRVIATALWLRTGLTTNVAEIPKRMLLASCERVLSVRENVVANVVKFSNSLGAEKAQQLELMLKQDRSQQVLMDKTLGASGVISEDNIEVLFEEMLEPFKDEIREEAAQEVAQIRSSQRKTNRAAKDRVDAADRAKEAAEAEVKARDEEDLRALLRTGLEVQGLLNAKLRRRKFIAVALAAVAGILAVYSENIIAKVVGFGFAAIMSYLTLVGSSLIKLNISSDVAVAAFRNHAEKIGLSKKLIRVKIEWEAGTFKVNRSDQ